MIAELQPVLDDKPIDFYYLLCRWGASINEEEKERTFISKHGNAKKPFAGDYQRRHPDVKTNVDSLLAEKVAVDEIYLRVNKLNTTEDPAKIIDSKYVHNRKYALKLKENINPLNQAEAIINSMQKNNFIRRTTFEEDRYSTFNYHDIMMGDIVKYCVNGESIFNVDTTFELADGLWLTDSCYENLSLIDEHGKHPFFPGPSRWHFRKDTSEFRKFATDMISFAPETIELRKLGFDLDQAQSKGLKEVFKNSFSCWCTHHIQGACSDKLSKMRVNCIDRIMADIFGSQVGPVQELGLADAENVEDLTAKLNSLEEDWQRNAPGFFDYFKQNHFARFSDCLVQSARDKLQIDGRYYNNNLELLHKLQKKKREDLKIASKDVVVMSDVLNRWIEENFYSQISLAIRGKGKYRLAPEYATFYVSPSRYRDMTDEQRSRHITKFLQFIPTPSNTYKKPQDSGKKKKVVKRRATQEEPALFVVRHDQSTPAIAPVKIRKSAENWAIHDVTDDDDADDDFDPDRDNSQPFHIVVRSDVRNCPKLVKRCEQCRIPFTTEKIVVRSMGNRPHTDSKGNEKIRWGNVYLHYLTDCLSKFNPDFRFSNVKISKDTAKLLTTKRLKKLTNKGCKLE
ncbi:uncharacterized protein [Clytia hemisphaerica]